MSVQTGNLEDFGHSPSRLLQSENFATAEARTELAKAIYAANFGQYHLVAGKGV